MSLKIVALQKLLACDEKKFIYKIFNAKSIFSADTLVELIIPSIVPGKT